MPEYWESVSEIPRTPLERPQQPIVRGTAASLFEGPHQPVQVALASFRRRCPVHGVDGVSRAPLTPVFCKLVITHSIFVFQMHTRAFAVPRFYRLTGSHT